MKAIAKKTLLFQSSLRQIASDLAKRECTIKETIQFQDLSILRYIFYQNKNHCKDSKLYDNCVITQYIKVGLTNNEH